MADVISETESISPGDVLEIGCGNSRLCEELRKDSVADITCIDISPVAVERMQNRLRDMGLEGADFTLILLCL
ncbi:hypothetical protein BHE74_00047994 [Ensete ventricosum]|nr:hypothetical protein GW17_00004822 [Ensete ventricosum]RWW46101.1 hypothetical protein BHE74_00047994 [Ensete ventricosum]RZS05188.1 hypothetical protein BHM03_00035667 [Ensete ventricosum]